MKKKQAAKSEAVVADATEQKDYVVGLVSDSLTAEKITPGTLSSLFSVAATKNTLVFSPAPKPKTKSSPVNLEAARVPDSEAAKQKKTKQKSAAEKKLEDREEALKNADDAEEEKRPKKAKRKSPAANDDGETAEEVLAAKRRKVAWNKAEERIKLKRTVFVGNLPVNCSKKDLKKIFKDVGAIESVRFRSVLREDPTMSRRLAAIRRQVDPKKASINAYVVFKEDGGAANALQRNGTEIQKDVYIRVDRVSQHGSHDHKRSVFVGNLPYDIMELSLRQHFEECGKVEAVRLVRDRNTGVGKGFGYILFESTDAVMLALKLNGSQLLDRKIRVKRSVKKEKVKKENEKRGRGPAGKGQKGQQGQNAARKRGPQPANFKGPNYAESSKPTGKSFKKHPGMGNQTPSSFRGNMADPASKKGKGLRKKFSVKKKSKAVHI
ncbi:RNA-binding protein 34 isoform X1 [Tachysurus fulvidraco]|uniref:RNA-binding protein 34 isoform X1 n=1 Tax=Tachysurus fulvidraco TaxID=1234273 RepID=UPI000F4FB74F|nr:RNA-binding protein 34 isoform X1 [Tachysurus fulvidraco]